MSYFRNSPALAGKYLGNHGIRLVILPYLPRTYLDGAALLLPNGDPAVGLTFRYDRVDNFWFSLLHELVHIARHLMKDKQVIVDDLDLRKHEGVSRDAMEKDATIWPPPLLYRKVLGMGGACIISIFRLNQVPGARKKIPPL